jgi:hypothetical protein
MFSRGASTPPFISMGGEVTKKVTESVTTYLLYIYIYRYYYVRLGEDAIVLQNLLDGGPSHNRPLLGSFESMRGGTLGTNPH